jgi:alpha-amylase/alpha-mannosidase (GH57 family)
VKFITVHGHFYQPARENPWLEFVEVQDGALPYHDWNDRITAECYAPNTAARRVDDDNRILDLVNNYEKISFNVGPTLLAWLEQQRPAVYAKIVEADRTSRAARAGHGNAIAQAYGHAILPLATRRDKVTQVRWGIEDFRHRFGREPEGMWLPETAVDAETLEVLAEAGMRFTVLAPHQAARIRALDGEEWTEAGDQLDPSRPYRWCSPGGASLALFFYDGPISRAIAFGDALSRGERFVEYLREGFSDARAGPQLVHCATDGESYGHHSKFGEMALAAALQQIEREGLAELTNYGAFLTANPPAWEAEIHDNTSWSCPHGVERWRADCECRVRSDYHQRWRGPLRDALDWLRGEVDRLFEDRAGALLKDPWEARDDYIRVVLDRTWAAQADFFGRHQQRQLEPAEQVSAMRLLELQRQRLLMYTSCGWFFDEISSIEPLQVLRYAAMAIQYVWRVGGGSLEDEFLKRLALAPSNIPEVGDGANAYRRFIRPEAVDFGRVVAHYAMSGLFEDHAERQRIYAFTVTRLSQDADSNATTALRVGRIHVRSDITGETDDLAYAVLHHGGYDFHCGARRFNSDRAYEDARAELLEGYTRGSVSDVVRALDRHFPEGTYTFRHLFLDDRRRLLARIAESAIKRHETAYRRIWEESRRLVHYLRESGAPAPDALTLVGRHVLTGQVTGEIAESVRTGEVSPRIFDLKQEADVLGLPLDLTAAAPLMRQAIATSMEALAARPTPERVRAAVSLIDCAQRLDLHSELAETQSRFFEIWHAHPTARPTLGPLGDRLGFRLGDSP